MSDFCVFILTYGRANNVITYKTLREQGYTGLIYLICSDDDKQIDDYVKTYGKEYVIIFNKLEIAKTFDRGNNFNNLKIVTYARNFTFTAAKQIGIKYFLMLDDDYVCFRYRWADDKYLTKGYPKNLDKAFNIFIDYFKSSNLDCIALSQGGDFIGGESCGLITNYLYNSRKIMNSFFCATDKPFQFLGSINEDVNSYVSLARLGYKFMTLPHIAIEQKQTQAQAGGLTDIYLEQGTYVKSFSTVIMSPSCVKVAMMGATSKRLHHLVSWKMTTPMIISENHRKAEQ